MMVLPNVESVNNGCAEPGIGERLGPAGEGFIARDGGIERFGEQRCPHWLFGGEIFTDGADPVEDAPVIIVGFGVKPAVSLPTAPLPD